MSGKFVFLHLSDLHFGDENETDAARRKNTLDKLLLTLKDLPAEWEPQAIVISGDIGWKGVNKDYLIAEKWLRELLKVLGLSAKDIIPAPGNHDINLNEAAATAVPSDHITADELLDITLLEKVSEPFKGFEDFCKRMKIPPLTLGSKTSFLAGSREHKGMMWVVLNSAWFCREGRKEKLHIGLPHLDVITAAAGWSERGLPTIGVLHHPPECLHDEELHSYGKRRNTYDFLAGECDMILSGHVHGELSDPDVKYDKSCLFTGGSCYENEKEQNNFSVFRVDSSARTVERRAYEWVPGNGKWEHRETYSKSLSLAGGEGKPGQGDLRGMLFSGSRRHYEDLCGGTGRFRHLDISDIILPQPNKGWFNPLIKSFSGVKGAALQKSPLASMLLDPLKSTLLDIIPQLWQNECRHAVVKGDGGMGKTVSLVRLWDEFTKDYQAGVPVPVFIQLNEINTVPEEKRMNFILSSIRENYLNSGVSEEEIMNFLRDEGEVPSVVLLLDGFNEVTVDNKELLIQVRKLMEQARGVQVVITSRYDMRGVYGWEHLHLLELAGLEEAQVREYLEDKKVKMPGGRLAGLLRNPMMLTLYTSTCEVQEKCEGNFKRQVETAGELLWNFMEAQAAVLLERLNYDQKKWWFYKFLLKFMLPAMGYEMEKAGLFAFERDALYGALDRYYLRFSRPDFFKTFADYAKYEESLPTGTCVDDKARRKRLSEIEDILCNVLFMIVKEGETYRFLHQDFRDYFTTLHVLHEAEMGVKRGDLAEELKERALPVYILRFMGEIEGEHYQRPVFQEGKGWVKKEDGASLLNRVLDLCRGVFDGSVGFGPWNVVEVWKEVRGELSGSELSELDLSGVVLNGVRCSRFYKSDYLAARFDGSLLHETNLFPQGHTKRINSAVYSPDGKKILSASDDHTIKEWDVESGQCLKTFTGHTGSVMSAVYSRDGKKILSASFDKTIIEWDVESIQCIKTFAGHKDAVTRAGYSGDGEKILSTSLDKTIKEWDVESGQCLKTFTGHEYPGTSAIYSKDGKKVLSASFDKTIKEWDVESGQCLKTFTGHTGWVMSAVYSGDGKKILSASWDGTIKEWDVESGQCLKTFTGHKSAVWSAVYSGDGGKILSASNDHTIKEWDVESGQCLKTFTWHTKGVVVVGAVYNGDGKKILSASVDGTIKEWDVESGQCLKTFIGHKPSVWKTKYSVDGKKILSASGDHTIKEWDVESGHCLKTFIGHTGWVISAVYNADGKKILSASWDHTIKEWDVDSGQCLNTFTIHSDYVYTAVYSRDEKKILSAMHDGTIKEWDVENGLCLKTFTGHTDRVLRAVYSIDGKKILSTSDDHTIKEWDVESGLCLKTTKGTHPDINIKEYLLDAGEVLKIEDNRIEMISRKTRNPIRIFINIPGLFIQGCSFKNLHSESDLSPKCKKRLRQYGAKFE